MNNETYKSGSLLVKGNLFRTPRRSYRISDIEKVTIKRPLFWLGLPLSLGSFLLITQYAPYLYEIEKQVCIGMFTAMPLILWNIGTLSLTSKSYRNDDAVTGFMPRLKRTRIALEDRMFEIIEHENNITKEDDNG